MAFSRLSARLITYLACLVPASATSGEARSMIDLKLATRVSSSSVSARTYRAVYALTSKSVIILLSFHCGHQTKPGVVEKKLIQVEPTDKSKRVNGVDSKHLFQFLTNPFHRSSPKSLLKLIHIMSHDAIN